MDYPAWDVKGSRQTLATGGIDAGKQVSHTPLTRQHQIRRQVMKRQQHKGSIGYARVRQRKSLIGYRHAIQMQHVQIERAWPPSLTVTHAPSSALDAQQGVEQIVRRQCSIDMCHRIDESRLIQYTPRRRQIERRTLKQAGLRQACQRVERSQHLATCITEIAAQRDESFGHA